MAAPTSFLEHLQLEGYHSRSNKHSNAFARALLSDLISHCPKIRNKAKAGQIVYRLNFTLMAGTSEWNVDLVLGPPELGTQPPADDVVILEQTPTNIEIAIELKAVMTKHHGAVKNRKRDLEAHHEHVHNYNNEAIAGGILLINAAPIFQSPLLTEASIHRNPDRLVEHCVSQVRAVSTRGGMTGYGLEAKCALVLSMDNMGGAVTYISASPAPPIGDPMHYDAFIRSICEHYTRRF
jgi:hypothetical protein